MRLVAAAGLAALLLVSVAAAYAAWTDRIEIRGTVYTGDVEVSVINESITNRDSQGTHDFNASSYPKKGSKQLDRDFASTDVTLESDDNGVIYAINVNVDKAYPWYFGEITFDVESRGSVPIVFNKIVIVTLDQQDNIIDKVVITCGNTSKINRNNGVELDANGDGYNDTRFWVNHVNYMCNYVLRDADSYITLDLAFTILPAAPEDSTLRFRVEYVFTQWNAVGAGGSGG